MEQMTCKLFKRIHEFFYLSIVEVNDYQHDVNGNERKECDELEILERNHLD